MRLKCFATFGYWSAQPPLLRSQYGGRKFGFEKASAYPCAGLTGGWEVQTIIFSRRRNQ